MFGCAKNIKKNLLIPTHSNFLKSISLQSFDIKLIAEMDSAYRSEVHCIGLVLIIFLSLIQNLSIIADKSNIFKNLKFIARKKV